jgi:hypothetical protein
MGAVVALFGAAVEVIPGLFRLGIFGKRDPLPGPDALRVTGRDEGDPVSWGVGTEVPVAGTLIWHGPLKKKTSGGGKGGGGKGEAPTTTYKVDVAIGFMRRETVRLRRLWLGGDLLIDTDVDVSIVGTTFTATRYTVVTPGNDASPGDDTEEFLDLSSSSPSNDLSRLRTGFDCTVAGFTSAGNNGTFRVVQAYKLVDGTSKARLRKPSGNAVNEAAGDTVTITQDFPEFSGSRLSAYAFYNGADDQLPNSIIEAVEGAGNVPGWRGWTYMVIQNLDVTKWGGSFPECRALIEERETCTLAEAVREVCIRGNVAGGVGITDDDIDVSALTAIEFKGITTSGPTTGVALLLQMAIAYNLDAQERDGKIVFSLASSPSTISVPNTDWGAHEEDEGGSTSIPAKTVPRQTLANQYDVKFLLPDRDWQEADSAYRLGVNPRNISEQIVLGIVLSRAEGDAIAKKMAVRAGFASSRKRVTLPPRYVEVLEGDNLLVTEGSNVQRLRVERSTRGDNGLIEVEVIPESLVSFTQSVTVETGAPGDSQGETTLPSETAWIVADLPPLSDADAKAVGLYVGAGPFGPEDPFVGATIYRSADGEVSFIAWQNILISSTFGNVSGTLGTGTEFFKDTKNVLTVVLHSETAELDSASDEAVLLGSNRILVGNEVIGFTTATLTAARTYQLTGLYRGLNGTHNEVGSHTANEPCVLLDGAVQFVEVGVSAIGALVYHKGVPAGGDEADFPSRSMTPVGKSATPLDAYAIQGTRDSGTNDLTITWLQRSRGSYNVITGGLPPLMDGTERYEIDVLDGSDVVRTIVVSSATSTVYTAAQQTTDFGSAQASVDIIIYQIGDLVGRGRPSPATV